MSSPPAGSPGSKVALKLVAGTACGYLAYKARVWGSGPNAPFVVWTLVALAGNFYIMVISEFTRDIFKPRSVNSTPMIEAANRLTYSVIAVVLAALAARFGQAPLTYIIKTEHSNAISLLLAGSIWTFGILGAAPIFAGRYSAQAIENLIIIVDRRSADRRLYGGITAVAGIGIWALAMYLVYLGYVAGGPYS